MSCFIHKSLYQDDYMKHLDLYMQRFLYNASHVFMVFDGKPPKAKREEILRRKNAKIPPKIITPEMVFCIVEKYKCHPKVSIVFSPSESDAQLAYLANSKYVDLVITEDSDLVVYGCSMILYKMKPRGDCILYDKSLLRLPWDFSTFKKVCVLCGCDYLRTGLRGFGFQTAIKLLKCYNFSIMEETGQADQLGKEERDDNWLWDLLRKHNFSISDDFRHAFTAAVHAFDRQLVFCMVSKTTIEYCKAM